MISKRVLEDIRAKCDIVDIISSYFHLQRTGSTFRALCPFHKEKTPSFHVNPQRQIFHCFGCGAGGDVFRFVMQHESVDFMTAAKMLAEKAGIRLEMDSGRAGPSGAEKDVLYRLHADVADIFHRGLLKSPAAEAARKYLKSRNLSDEVVKDFLIGYAPDEWSVILNWAQKKKYTVPQLEAGGLVIKSERAGVANPYYDRFRNRLMFPIRDEQGRVIGFSGRALEKDAKGAKYINSPETPLFRKSRVLYALDKARHAIVDQRQAIICEGQIDVIRCHSAGFTTAVASQGTAFTEEHARVLKRYADEVVLVFDSDTAGQDAAIKTAGVFMQVGLGVRVATLPAGEDPDSLILKKGAEAFAAVLKGAKSVVDFQIDILASRFDLSSENGLTRITRSVLETISQMPDPVQRDRLIKQAEPRLGHAHPGVLRAELAHMARRVSRSEEKAPAGVDGQPPPEEVMLAEHLVASPELAALVEQYLPLDMIANPLCRAAIEAAMEAGRTQTDVGRVMSARDEGDGELSRFVARIVMAPAKAGGKEFSREAAVRDLILRTWARKLKRRALELDRLRSEEPGRNDKSLGTESAQLRADVKALDKWETGEPIIKLLLGSH